jgi:CheY-like chemotaxis protein
MMPPRSRILCVDDEPAVLRLLEALLIKNGYEVIKAGNGEEAS